MVRSGGAHARSTQFSQTVAPKRQRLRFFEGRKMNKKPNIERFTCRGNRVTCTVCKTIIEANSIKPGQEETCRCGAVKVEIVGGRHCNWLQVTDIAMKYTEHR